MGRSVTTGASKRQAFYRAASEYLLAMRWERHNRSGDFTFWTHPNFPNQKISTAQAIETQLVLDSKEEHSKRWRPERLSFSDVNLQED